MDALRDLFLVSSRSNVSVATMVATSDFATVVLSLIQMKSSNSVGNSTGLAFLPTYVLPNALGSVSVEVSETSNSASQVLVTLMSLAEGLVVTAHGQAMKNSTSLPLTIVSDVVSVKVSAVNANGTIGTSVLPIFKANLSVNSNVSTSSVIRYFSHNCSVGVEETVSFLCPGSCAI